jgi:DNA-binding phage protein
MGDNMSDSSDAGTQAEPPRRKRGRPPGSRKNKKSRLEADGGKPHLRGAERDGQGRDSEEVAWQTNHILPSELATEAEREGYLAYSLAEEQMTQFSAVLRKLVRRNRAEIMRVARELEVSENTIYRWMNGSSEPRALHLRRLLEVFPSQRENLLRAITQTFGEVPETRETGLSEVSREIYHQVLELLAEIGDDEMRFWRIAQVIFTHALRHLDADRRGLAITFAKLMPPREDGIHSLREMRMQGTEPWSHFAESRLYLGSTTLAGMAVELQRMQLWDTMNPHSRTQVEVDVFERSACAVPILRGNLVGGALIISSTQASFFHNPRICQFATEYALLTGVALADQEFYPHASIALRPMPELSWQRERISQVYRQSILTYAHMYGISRRDAELRLQDELERAFEKQARTGRLQPRDSVSATRKPQI